MKETTASFASGDLLLEGRLAMPDGTGPFPVVIVCHPHPLYGGSMDNDVVCTVSEALTRASLASLRFNFRGVGLSQGKPGHGRGERQDVQAALSFVMTQEKISAGRLGLAGYSAGAAFALPVGCDDQRVVALAAISPPFDTFDFRALNACRKPKLMVLGSRDDLIHVEEFLEFCRNLPEPNEYEIVEGADHLWQGHEPALAARVAAFFAAAL